MATVRETVTARIRSLMDRKQHLASEIVRIQAEIDALVAERAGLTSADDDKFARLQALSVIRADV